jgi:hypothetical protein
MLAKVPIRGANSTSSFAALVTYIAKGAAGITHSPGLWSVETAASEMQQVASFSRAKNPVYHYILSWREGESPTNAQAFEATTATLTALRMHENQWVAAIHRNTHNVHAHVAVNRVHPESHKAVSLSWDWLKLDRTCREMELKQGWLHDRGPHRIEIVADQEPQIVRHQGEPSPEIAAKQSTKARDYEAWSGRESFQTWLGKKPAQVLERLLEQGDSSWQKVHKELASFNLEYRLKGSGAVVVDRDEPDKLHAKASHLGRFASRGKLEARLGPFEGPAGAPERLPEKSYKVEVQLRTPSLDRGDPSMVRQFESAVIQRRVEQASTKAGAWQKQLESERSRYAQLRADKRGINQEIRGWAHPAKKQLLYAVATIGAAVKREQLRDEIRQERRQLRSQFSTREPRSWRAWLVQQVDAGDRLAQKELATLRYRDIGNEQLDQSFHTSIEADRGPSLGAILGGLTARGSVSGVYFMDKGRTVFCDQGARIVFDDLNENYIKAGLAFAREKWAKGIYLSGTDAFREKATRLAAEMGITVHGGVLQKPVPDLGELSRSWGKPISVTRLANGRRHTGELVAAAVESESRGLVVIDAGRELALIHTDAKTAADLQNKIGRLVRAHAAIGQQRQGAPSELAWRVQELERTGPDRGIGIGR